MFPSLCASTFYGASIEALIWWFFTFAVITKYFYWNKQNLYSLYQYDLLLHGFGLVAVQGHKKFYISHFWKCPWSGWSCCTLHISFHGPGIFWTDGWNHNIWNSGLWVFWDMFVVFLILSLCPFYCFYFVTIFCLT